jgi:hypothetical protein
MVEVIGILTIGALVWLLAWLLAGESDAERRKIRSAATEVPPSRHSGKVVEIRRAA